jgi:hypothetical protein
MKIYKNTQSFSASEHCPEMYPEECQKIHGCPGMAMVEATDQNHSNVKRSQNRRPTEVENSKFIKLSSNSQISPNLANPGVK